MIEIRLLTFLLLLTLFGSGQFWAAEAQAKSCLSDHAIARLQSKYLSPSTSKALWSTSLTPGTRKLLPAHLPHILKERVSGTRGNAQVRQYIVEQLESFGYRVNLDHFTAATPLGTKEFTNIVATTNEYAPHHVIVAAHYDSKYFEEPGFLGATDSAAPCAMLLVLAQILADLKRRKLFQAMPAISIDFLFFDGEEAFEQWTREDSIYGAKHLAESWNSQPPSTLPGASIRFESVDSKWNFFKTHHPSYKNRIEQIGSIILLDLLGSSSPWPELHDFFDASSAEFVALANMETRLKALGMLSDLYKRKKQRYFVVRSEDTLMANGQMPNIDDDHRPFLELGVPVVHLIPYPFPTVWHTMKDDAKALNADVINDLTLIILGHLIEVYHEVPETAR